MYSPFLISVVFMPRGRFLAKIRIRGLIFPSDVKKENFIFLLVWSAWKNLHPFRSNSNDLCITTGAFSLPEHLVHVF